MKIYYCLQVMKKHLWTNTTWLGSQHMDAAMKILYETKLQHQGYGIHQYSIYHGHKRLRENVSNIFT